MCLSQYIYIYKYIYIYMYIYTCIYIYIYTCEISNNDMYKGSFTPTQRGPSTPLDLQLPVPTSPGQPNGEKCFRSLVAFDA